MTDSGLIPDTDGQTETTPDDEVEAVISRVNDPDTRAALRRILEVARNGG